MMEISIIFKIAALGIVITVLGQVLKHSGREEMTFLLSLRIMGLYGNMNERYW